MKVVGAYRLPDGSLTEDMTAEEIPVKAEKYGITREKRLKMWERYFNILLGNEVRIEFK